MCRNHLLFHHILQNLTGLFLGVTLFSGCAADLTPLSNTSTNTETAISAQQKLAASLPGARIDFHYSNFYTLTNPNSYSCAGDANVYYDPVIKILPEYPSGYTGYSATTGPTGPYAYPTDLIDTTTTIRPSFIKNISVDMTDTNSASTSNNAYACSYGSGTSAPPVSNCATFDYGAIQGIPSALGGSLVLFGGIQGYNYFGTQSIGCGTAVAVSDSNFSTYYNSCSNSMYALGVNTLPASAAKPNSLLTPGLSSATTAISTWSNISGVVGYTGPSGTTGSSIIYNSSLENLLLFGGVSPLSNMGPAGSSSPVYNTWVYNIRQQTWTQVNNTFTVDSSLTRLYDFNSSSSVNQTIQLAKTTGGRALFGYAAIPGLAIDHLSLSGLVTGTNGASVDTTDRIVTVGGLGQCNGGVCTDTHRFNPTFGPEYYDLYAPQDSPSPLPNTTLQPIQWVDSYPTQLMSNSATASNYQPTQFPPPSPTPSDTSVPKTSINFGLVGLNNNYANSAGVGPGGVANSIPGTGYPLVAGGFYGYPSDPAGYLNVPSGIACPSNETCGDMKLQLRWFASGYTSQETSASNFSAATNYKDSIGTQNTPVKWVSIADQTSPKTTPWFGGSIMLKGINIPITPAGLPTPIPPGSTPSAEETNQVVYFGGAPCQKYMDKATTNCGTWPTIGNLGRYWVFGSDPGYTFNSGTSYPTKIDWGAGTTPPINAGMAAARGTDLSGNPIIVAYGGMSSPGNTDESGTIYFLYRDSLSNQPAWGSYTVTSGIKPRGLANSAMVFSHVTGKFYLFGGYNSNYGTNADTWELTLVNNTSVGALPNCGVASTPSCQFQWKQLNISGGLTCYPTCPGVRRSHRMVEANYNNFNSPFEPVCTSSTRPCSFGIFMEGGTADGGTNYYSDRWMFDPTANGGVGHWQQVGDFPPRLRSSMANVDYTVTAQGVTVHRAIMFGGETGMQNPLLAKTINPGNYFVPPTLGDTWMFDYTQNSWNRVTLYGERYNSAASASFAYLSEKQARSSSVTSDPTTQVFSPPPLSGAIMVTRTLSKPSHLAYDTPQTLKIPEVFLFGGRKKDGYYQLIDQVYKFCAGSTGEKPYPSSMSGLYSVPGPDDASCDAYDETTNPNSPNPTKDFVGKWLLKKPLGSGIDPSQVGSFMGAGTYDPTHDRIILMGGLSPKQSPYDAAAITDTSNQMVGSSVLEYTPPSAVSTGTGSYQYNGYWSFIPSCTESPETPVGRYGHSLAYDTLNKTLILTGGNDIHGNPLVQSQTDDLSNTATIPEIWSGYRVDAALPVGVPQLGIPPILSSTPCYYWSRVRTFGNSFNSSLANSPRTGLSFAASVFIPSSGYNTGYYTMYDSSCAKSGPIASPDSSINKLLVGGTYIDIDRTQLGSNENLILNLTFIPLGPSNVSPNESQLTSDETAILRVHLVRTGESGDAIRSKHQPRDLTYASTDVYPETARSIAIIAPPTGQIRQEQIFIPLSLDPASDRIRIERYSGSAILIDASIYRMGRPD